MSVPVVAFFNNRGGVGTTSLVYHLAWMYAEIGRRVLAVDLDPQANLTAAFLSEERFEELVEADPPATIYGSIRPLIDGTGDISLPATEDIEDSSLSLLAGDLSLSSFEDDLSTEWPKCLDGNTRSFRVISAFWRAMQEAAKRQQAEIILMDLGPNLGAINRAALIAADHVVIPLAPDLYSLLGLSNLGPTLRTWREGWSKRLEHNPITGFDLPSGDIRPMGYVVMQHAVRLDRPVKAYDRWIGRIPSTYRKSVLGEPGTNSITVANDPRILVPTTAMAQGTKSITVANDPNCLATLKHYHSLMPLAQEAHKPMFLLRPADGALGAHQQAVQRAYREFRSLAERILTALDS